jgi:signal transduction histidine kinase
MNAAGADIYGTLRAPTDDPTVPAFDPTAYRAAARARRYIREDGSPLPAEQAPGARALRGETVVNQVVGFVRAEHDVSWLRVSAAPLLESGAQLGAVVSFADVTAAKQREEALRDVNQQLRDVDRRKTEFLALLSHELRNPHHPAAACSGQVIAGEGNDAGGGVLGGPRATPGRSGARSGT